MDNLFVILDEEGEPVHLDSAPWNDGECLIHRCDGTFTVFPDRKAANRAFRVTKKYAAKFKLEWGTDEWKVETLQKYLLENHNAS